MLTWCLNKSDDMVINDISPCQVFRWRRRAPVPPPFHPRPRADGPCWPICHRVQRHLLPRTGRLERESHEKDDLKISRKITKDMKNLLKCLIKCLIKWIKSNRKSKCSIKILAVLWQEGFRGEAYRGVRAISSEDIENGSEPWEILRTPSSKHHRVVRISSGLSLRRCHHHHEGLLYSCISSNHQRKWWGRGMQLVTKETGRWELPRSREKGSGLEHSMNKQHGLFFRMQPLEIRNLPVFQQ